MYQREKVFGEVRGSIHGEQDRRGLWAALCSAYVDDRMFYEEVIKPYVIEYVPSGTILCQISTLGDLYAYAKVAPFPCIQLCFEIGTIFSKVGQAPSKGFLRLLKETFGPERSYYQTASERWAEAPLSVREKVVALKLNTYDPVDWGFFKHYPSLETIDIGFAKVPLPILHETFGELRNLKRLCYEDQDIEDPGDLERYLRWDTLEVLDLSGFYRKSDVDAMAAVLGGMKNLQSLKAFCCISSRFTHKGIRAIEGSPYFQNCQLLLGDENCGVVRPQGEDNGMSLYAEIRNLIDPFHSTWGDS